MGIESTVNITRERAVERISTIIEKIDDADWVGLYDLIYDYEDPDFLDELVNNYNEIDKECNANNRIFKSIDKWPNKTLEDFMDKRGVRFSIFENYMIEYE